ncbi:hypothetical protein KEJ49_03570 [Candidatus Bathyarchaeota archaeon]|nr:hypothetical protein [Candidatus Bathyarchaeota archaeon]
MSEGDDSTPYYEPPSQEDFPKVISSLGVGAELIYWIFGASNLSGRLEMAFGVTTKGGLRVSIRMKTHIMGFGCVG